MAIGTGLATEVNRAPKSINERLEQLEKDFKRLEANLGNPDQKPDQQRRELQAKLDQEVADLRAGVQKVGEQLEEGMIADSAFEVAGIVYVCIYSCQEWEVIA